MKRHSIFSRVSPFPPNGTRMYAVRQASRPAFMALLPIIYCGPPGLESEVFEAYMSSSGYQVEMATTPDAAVPVLAREPSAILVLAMPGSRAEIASLIKRFRSQSGARRNPIFVLTDKDEFDSKIDGVEVVTRPFRLSELISRIQSLSRR